MLVPTCVQKETRENFKYYLKIQSHDQVTRNNNYSLQIPTIKLKYAKNGFFCMCVTLYNELPTKRQKLKILMLLRKCFYMLFVPFYLSNIFGRFLNSRLICDQILGSSVDFVNFKCNFAFTLVKFLPLDISCV